MLSTAPAHDYIGAGPWDLELLGLVVLVVAGLLVSALRTRRGDR